MRISTEIGSPAKLVGEEKAVELVAKAGFDAWDFSLFGMCEIKGQPRGVFETDHPLSKSDYLTYVRRLRNIGLDNGIVCNQSHAPFPSIYPDCELYLKRAIECTAEAGGNICVIHPENSMSVEDNIEMYRDLLPFAKECGVKIATENMWAWDKEANRACFAICATEESFCHLIDAVDDEFMVACLDIGHAEIMGDDVSSEGLIRALGKRLAALHIHDNDRLHDSHQIPFSMNIDFSKVIKALKEINYSGYFTLEAIQHLENFDKQTVLIGLKELSQSAKKLWRMFEE